MSTSTSRAAQESTPAVPHFSYAQAAKGRAGNTGFDKSRNTPSPGAAGSATERTVSSDRGGISGSQDKSSAKRTASEGRVPENTEKIEKGEALLKKVDETAMAMNDVTPRTLAQDETQKLPSTTSSPEHAPMSVSSIHGGEESLPTVNGALESTWERHSQSSQDGANPGGEADAEERPDANTNTKWDEEVPTEPTFREAPPPSMNIWQQRKEAQAARVMPKQPTGQPSITGRLIGEQELPNGVPQGAEGQSDVKKQEPKKKSKAALEEKTKAESMRGFNKDRKSKIGTDEKSAPTIMAPPPPPGDAISWPTPENAITEEKKKSQAQPKIEEGEKEKEPSHKPRSGGKQAWKPMAFVPSVAFETHVPQSRRGGRGPSGGRDHPTRGRNNGLPSHGGDKPGNTSTPSTPRTAADDSKAMGVPVAFANAPPRSKRASSAGPVSSKEQRKTAETPTPEKGREASKEDTRTSQSRKVSANDSRKMSAVPVPATPQINIPNGRASHAENAVSVTLAGSAEDGEKTSQPVLADPQSHTKPFATGRRSEGSMRANELPKESYGNGVPREREERAERGRGRGGRGRGGVNHSNYNGAAPNGNTYPNGQGYTYQPPFNAPSRSFSNHERMSSQSQGPYFGTSPHRSSRSGSRSQYSASYVPAGGRFSHGPNGGPANLPNIQTDVTNMPYYANGGPQGVMSAIPYNPYEEPPVASIYDLVQMQMEYYFSVDNLCKDVFLRTHMDSQGWIFPGVIANFNRIRQLTVDIEVIRYVCIISQKIEFKPAQVWQDGQDRLRVKEGWSNFVLPMDKRDASVQHDGPIPAPTQQQREPAQGHDDRQMTSPRTMAPNGPMDFPYQSLNAMAPLNMQTPLPGSIPNGNHNPTNHVPLSAAVSEFSPAAHSHVSRRLVSPDSRPQETKLFPDEDVQNLQILVREPVNSSLPPFPSASSRTFSNGSIDGRNFTDELSASAERQSRPVNGDVFESDRSARSRSPYVVGSPSKQLDLGRSPPVFWMKNKDGASTVDTSPNDCDLEAYPDFRRDTLNDRKQAAQETSLWKMQILYGFWSHFLIRNYNARMYEEFRNLAVEDKTTRKSNTGMQYLMQYYDEALLGPRAIVDDNVACHYVELVQGESLEDRQAFKKLRTAWRNGAFNPKNRSKMMKLIPNNLKEELDR